MCKRIASTFLLILWMSVIFGFSAQPATESSKLSGTVREAVVKIAEKILPELGEKIDAERGGKGLLTALIRKTAHFTCFLILGILGMWTLSAYGVERKRRCIVLVFCILYAISDEVHQIFVSGRAGKIMDVLIDTAGSAAGICFYTAFRRGCRFLQNRRGCTKLM